MTTGGTTFVNPASSETLLRSKGKNPERSIGNGSGANNLQDSALVEAEEKMMDEEITSVEDNHEEVSSVEHHLVNAVLVESAKSSNVKHDASEILDSGDDDSKESRYGLRKRRRPTGHDVERLEHYQSSKDGGLMRHGPPPSLASEPDLSTSSDNHESKGAACQPIPNIAQPAPPSLPCVDVSSEAALIQPTIEEKSVQGTTTESKNAFNQELRSKALPSESPIITESIPHPQHPKAQVPRPKRSQIPNISAASIQASAPKSSIVPHSIMSVPNPLLQFVDEIRPLPPLPCVSMKPAKSTSSVTSSVPCPLPGPTIPDKTGSSCEQLSPKASAGISFNIGMSSASCTAPTENVGEKPPQTNVQSSRTQTPPALPPQSMLPKLPSKDADSPDDPDKGRKVTITEPGHLGSRIRGFSIDMDIGLDFDDLGTSQASTTEHQASRDRAFSFECFAFGINADEPLPPLEQSLPGMGRPRGDSIIFDPTSFQDGGIHEQKALEKPRGTVPPDSLPSPKPIVSKPTLSKPAALLPSSSSSLPPVVIGVKPQMISSEPVSGNSSGALLVNSATPGLSLELVNKDGRIGIYLPEARRARIARFHAKRAKRIWRKRIKYDCRKKLADSRPRIKGRFVKRTDMDED